MHQEHRIGPYDSLVAGAVIVEDLYCISLRRDAVTGDLLEHDGRRDDRADGVAACPAVADGITIDFVHDVVLAICLETSCPKRHE